MNILSQVISQVKLLRGQADSLLELLDATAALPAPEGSSTPARVPAKGNKCPHCGVSNPTRETAGGFGSGEETTYCGHCGKEF